MKAQSQYNIVLRQLKDDSASEAEQIQYSIAHDKTTIIGRDSRHCDIVLNFKRYPKVSREHLEIRPMLLRSSSGMPLWEICDLNSRNGTYVNGQRLQMCQILQKNDRIQVGEDGPEFIFECHAEDSSISLTEVFPIISKQLSVEQKSYIVPGIITVISVVTMLAARENSRLFITVLAAYLALASHYVIHKLCHTHKPWWLLVSLGLATGLPILGGLHIPPFQTHEEQNIVAIVLKSFFGSGLLVELFKVLPVLLVYLLGRFFPSPKRELLGVWKPMDGILLATASATGFAIVETILKVFAELEQKGAHEALTLLIPKVLGDLSGEVAYSGYFGYFIGLSALKSQKRWSLLGIGYLSAAFLHTVEAIIITLLKQNLLVNYLLLAAIGFVAYLFLMAAIVKARNFSPRHSH
ncbi:PrsW family glutamic-type intramembrane protease [Aetokthonos hydrillicola Thurmond2011]|jgi:RsiW-degrading membrane proteinase PrsW (M82 family)|uniref:PrsW family glutamic-type intramembrane protease n=1 Tax=Aetokthonos hydrillicola Thurmond2011 TaxID=2712845 RepID=A0AAP5IC29_9CYAN|nr:PrsW family glutamic-type intramembrane protease [Aetokthonos hydrillicola]MBO3462662.1 PrsW family intramembrane metalloprotease [Aetokthonos hydrillicola CCALA 1050]MBW4589884.1 PrsW family intramembrane metalloprotease [Aetokthonos hydrillicola CCALA 1050]MDR9896968.1 PrsW family glutamic-type intramembrane protease [Aetokthonos hydrillicola Thurmond2011]